LQDMSGEDGYEEAERGDAAAGVGIALDGIRLGRGFSFV